MGKEPFSDGVERGVVHVCCVVDLYDGELVTHMWREWWEVPPGVPGYAIVNIGLGGWVAPSKVGWGLPPELGLISPCGIGVVAMIVPLVTTVILVLVALGFLAGRRI